MTLKSHIALSTEFVQNKTVSAFDLPASQYSLFSEDVTVSLTGEGTYMSPDVTIITSNEIA